MRDLINLTSNLTESVGLANRKPGETFINSSGDLLTFIGLNFYPSEGKFDDHADMRAQIENIQERTGVEIEFTNQTNAKMLAFGIVTFNDKEGNVRLFGRYFATINAIFTGNYWPNSGLPDGFRYNKASAKKMSSGLMPQDILTSMENLTPEDILDQVVAKFGPTHPLTHLTNGISKGQTLPIFIDVTGYNDISFEGFRDYFCEILQPLAVLNGTTVGNADEAIGTFFGKKGAKGATISFSTGKNTGLYDSLLISPDGKQIKISTKGAVGAQASVGNLIDSIKDLELAGKTDLTTKYKDIIDIINIVKDKGYAEGPLTLAMNFGIISGKEADIVRSMKANPNAQLTKNLKKMYDERAQGADQERIVPYYNMLAAVAFAVADYVNEETDFSDAATEILNNSALIQVYTTAKKEDGRIILQQFKSVYPSNVVAGVQFSPYKNYFSTGNKGNFTFKILSNGAKPDSDTAPSVASTSKATAKKIDQAVDGHTSISGLGGGRRVGGTKKINGPRDLR